MRPWPQALVEECIEALNSFIFGSILGSSGGPLVSFWAHWGNLSETLGTNGSPRTLMKVLVMPRILFWDPCWSTCRPCCRIRFGSVYDPFRQSGVLEVCLCTILSASILVLLLILFWVWGSWWGTCWSPTCIGSRFLSFLTFRVLENSSCY